MKLSTSHDYNRWLFKIAGPSNCSCFGLKTMAANSKEELLAFPYACISVFASQPRWLPSAPATQQKQEQGA
jgi:hypothetical protein